jgi:hypothetical protein
LICGNYFKPEPAQPPPPPPPTTYERIRNGIQSITNIIARIIIRAILEPIIIHTGITANTIITIATIATIYVVFKLTKGRLILHKAQEINASAPVATVLHLNNTMQMQPASSNCNSNQNKLLASMIKQPPEFTGRLNIQVQYGQQSSKFTYKA